ncbi:hypothetical protein PVL29_006017 [Vitis rotundifolia]|uniref:Uncharacterized protein n=1 Tax=Vitis rotundifolia TaxID=103349 RepID=A0AA39DY96_VITRO|nr:hypothetical protein PVL29_006017 [Vitis rotundifolia]
MQSGNSQAAPSLNHQDSALAAADTRGKHRITAELKRLEQEARFLEERIVNCSELRVPNQLADINLFCTTGGRVLNSDPRAGSVEAFSVDPFSYFV